MAAGDIHRISIVGDWSGTDLAVNTFHFRMKSSGGTPAGAVAYLVTQWVSLIKGYQSNTFTWRYANVISVNRTPPVSSIINTGFPQVGAVATDTLPYQVALVCSLRTQYAGRSYRGRLYVPAITEAQNTAGRFTSTITSAFETYLADMLAGVGSGGSNADYEWGCWSQKLTQFNPYVSDVVREVPGIIRRRRIGTGV
jgi:hypothetical protein